MYIYVNKVCLVFENGPNAVPCNYYIRLLISERIFNKIYMGNHFNY